MKLKLLALLMFFGVLAVLSPAPHVHRAKFDTPKPSEENLERAQAYSKSIGVEGTIDMTPKHYAPPPENSDDGAVSAVRSSQNHMPHRDPQAVEAVRAAEKDVEHAKPSAMRTFIWLLVAGSFGYGAFFAFRRWADKNIPEPLTGYDAG